MDQHENQLTGGFTGRAGQDNGHDSDHDRLVRIEERQIVMARDIKEMKDCYLEVRSDVHGGENKVGLLTKVAELEQGRRANKGMIVALWTVVAGAVAGIIAEFVSR